MIARLHSHHMMFSVVYIYNKPSVLYKLYQVGEKLGKYEVEKRQAVENEDYDKAKLKKVQMEEYRLQMYRELGVPALLQEDPVSF